MAIFFFSREVCVIPESWTSPAFRGKKAKAKAASAIMLLAFLWKDAEGRSVQLPAFQYSICKNIFSLISVYTS